MSSSLQITRGLSSFTSVGNWLIWGNKILANWVETMNIKKRIWIWYDYHIEYNEKIIDRRHIYHEDNNLGQKEHLKEWIELIMKVLSTWRWVGLKHASLNVMNSDKWGKSMIHKLSF